MSDTHRTCDGLAARTALSSYREAEHERIWLEPICHDGSGEGRLWCQDRLDDCQEIGCEAKAVEFIRADIAAAEITRLTEELARTERNRDMWKGQCERQAEKLRAWQEWLGRIDADPENLEYLNGSAWDDARVLAGLDGEAGE